MPLDGPGMGSLVGTREHPRGGLVGGVQSGHLDIGTCSSRDAETQRMAVSVTLREISQIKEVEKVELGSDVPSLA